MTSGLEVPSALPEAHRTLSPSDHDALDVAEAGMGTVHGAGAGPTSRTRGPDRGRRLLGTLAFHLVALAGFTVPALVLWWHVWSGHPSATLTCSCGDPAQQVWFMEWPAWAVAHLHTPFFSDAVNVPDGANLLSNTSGTLVGVVLAPVTWAFGPVASANVALTMAPALSAWACFAAARPLVRWKPAAVPAGLVFGYSAAVVSSLTFGHVSVSLLVIPPFLFSTLHEILVRQEHSVRRDGLVLAALLVAQFFISPEIFVICGLLGVVGVVAVTVIGWRQLVGRAGHALPALALAAGLTAVILAYPVWYGLAGPQAVTGVLFSLAPLTGVPLSGLVSAGPSAAPAGVYIRFGGYLGRTGPPQDYIGPGVALGVVASLVVARRRPLTWLLALLFAVSLWFSLGGYLIGAPSWLWHLWLPWRRLSSLPVLKEILADQIAPFITLFLGLLLAVGIDALHETRGRPGGVLARHRTAVGVVVTVFVTLVAVVPVIASFDVPLRVVTVRTPPYVRAAAPALRGDPVWLTVPFAVSGDTQPMLWQAENGMRFRLAGAALKTPASTGGPVGSGKPGSARRILTDLSLGGASEPTGTAAQLVAVRAALAQWQVDEVVVAGASRDPVYASGFITMVVGAAPISTDGAWVWKLQPGWASTAPATGASLPICRVAAAAPAVRANRLFMAECVLFGAGRSTRQS